MYDSAKLSYVHFLNEQKTNQKTRPKS